MSKQSNSEPKRHHFVPEMHQKYFADSDGKLFYFLKKNPTAGIQHAICGNIFVEGHLYSIVNEDGEKDVSLEKEFAKFEGYIKPIITKIVEAFRNGDSSEITQENITKILRYLYIQNKRTPDFVNDLNDRFDPNKELSETFEEARQKFPQHIDEIDALDAPENYSRLIKNARVRAISMDSSSVLDVLNWRGLAVGRITVPRKSFILGSNPVVRMNSNKLMDIKTELWLPVAPDIAIGLGHADGKILAVNITDTAAIRRMNLAIAKQSNSFASPSRELVSSLANELGYKIK